MAGGQLALSQAIESFGNLTVGTQSNQTVTLTNNTASTVNFRQPAVSGSRFKLSGIPRQ